MRTLEIYIEKGTRFLLLRMRIAPTVLLPVVTFATCSAILVSASTEKRQGFFSCDGWGAGCSSSWKVPRPAPKPQPPPQKLRTPHIIRPYWLTTGNTWGPGKRSTLERQAGQESSYSVASKSLTNSRDNIISQLLHSNYIY